VALHSRARRQAGGGSLSVRYSEFAAELARDTTEQGGRQPGGVVTRSLNGAGRPSRESGSPAPSTSSGPGLLTFLIRAILEFTGGVDGVPRPLV
jgi:hypothetical protein